MDSLGNSLLNDTESKDFYLILDDGFIKKKIDVHKTVLKNSSPFFANMLGGTFYFYYVWCIPVNSIRYATYLIRYMYTRNICDLHLDESSEPMMKMCLDLEMTTLLQLINIYVKMLPQNTLKVSPETKLCKTHTTTKSYYNTRSKKQMKLRNKNS